MIIANQVHYFGLTVPSYCKLHPLNGPSPACTGYNFGAKMVGNSPLAHAQYMCLHMLQLIIHFLLQPLYNCESANWRMCVFCNKYAN